MIRITQNLIADRVIGQIHRTNGSMTDSLNKLATMRDVDKPSDDPQAAARAMKLQSALTDIDQHIRNVEAANSWTDVTDSALAQAGELAARMRELLISGGNAATGQPGRDTIANEIEGLIENIKQVANTKYGDDYVFGGARTTTPPYAPGPSDVYAGDNGQLNREIGAGITIAINVTGDSAFGDDTTGILKAARDIVSLLRSGTPADVDELQNGALRALVAASDQITSARARVGGSQQRLDLAHDRLADLELTSTDLLSKTRDADIARVMVDFGQQKAAYEAALKSGSQILQVSLVDFI